MTQDKRQRTRVDAGFEAYVTIGDVVIPVETKNISLKGALLTGCEDCFIGTECELHIPLSPGIRIVADGNVVRKGRDGIAMEFTEMDELSFTFLHRMVQLNAEEPESIDDELVQEFDKFE